MDQALPYRTSSNVLIPMRDGLNLAARLYQPRTAEPVPAIVSIMPYHKDGTYSSGYLDAAHRYLAERGYATLTVDLRGLGNSDGVAVEAFAAGERQDGYDLIEWVSAQDWCSGRLGMWGVSYGGITALSTASARPPSLKAIISIHAATDMYWDYLVAKGCRTSFSPDVHWATRMAASNLLPPMHDDPRADQIWRDRLGTYRPWLMNWHERGADDDYWRAAATLPEEIVVPTYVVGGWRDIFADISLDTFQHLAGPRKLLMGPWKHVFPDLAASVPIGFLPQMRRWWDRWLRDEQNGIDRESAITYFSYGADEWRDADQWPPPAAVATRFSTTGDRTLAPATSAAPIGHPPIPYTYTPLVGLDTIAMHWLPGPDQPVSRYDDEAGSLCFDFAPADQAVDLAGTPEVEVTLASPTRGIPLVVRLFALDTQGRSTLISMGWQRERLDAATPMNPGQLDGTRDVVIALRPIAWRLDAGTTLRLTISCADLSRIWPEPGSFGLELHRATLTLHLQATSAARMIPEWIGPPVMVTASRELGRERRFELTRDLISPVVSLRARTSQAQALDNGAQLETILTADLTVDGNHPAQTSLRAEAVYTLRRRSGVISSRATVVETTDRIRVEVEVSLDETRLYAGSWTSPVTFLTSE